MALKSLFPEDMMMKPTGSDMSLEGIATKLTYFHEQIHLIHWQTNVYAEHMATGALYDFVHDFKDGVIEKLMGYTGKKPRAFRMLPIVDTPTTSLVVTELKTWAKELADYANSMGYSDIENMAQDLSGNAAKTLYLLTLS